MSTPHTPPPLPPHVFQQAVEQAALAISITDAQAHILYSNPAFQQVTGYAAEEVLGRNESLLSYKVTPKLVYESMWAQLMRRRPWNGMLVNRRKDGSRYLAELTISPVLNETGEITHYLGLHRDVTEVHGLKRQVRNQKALIESVVDAAPVAVVLFDEAERVVLDNQEYKKLIGDLGSEPGRTLLQRVRERLGAGYEAARQALGGFTGQEVEIERAHGASRWFSCAGTWFEELDASADAFYEPQRRAYLLLVIQEITALKRQEEEIRTAGLRALLLEKERIQALREALYGAVFQLEGPFNQLSAALGMLERRGAPGDAPLRANLAQALSAGRAALETLRACVPEDSGEACRSLQLNALLADVLRIATPDLLTAGIVVDWSPGESLPAIDGRPQELASLFRQLLANAIEAIADARADRREIRLATRARGDHVEVEVEDSGPGIPAEWQLKVFQPFFTTKGAAQQHIGMGLAVAQDVVARHGGGIEVDPDHRGGCRLRVRLPRARKE